VSDRIYVRKAGLIVRVLVHSAEAAIALRQRLNETVDQLDALRKAHAELEVTLESQCKELTIAKSDRECRFPRYQLSHYSKTHGVQ
jgi:hypothetical protein